MQVIKIFILSLLCSPLFGQAGASMMMTSAAAGDTYLLDDYPAAAAYSLRLLKADHLDSAAIRVRRSSDNAEQDIGFTSEGYLDTASMKTFVGANDGSIVVWYDQSGNELDASQSIAINQPRIIIAGVIRRQNGFPTIDLDGLNDVLVSPNTSLAPQPTTKILVGSFDGPNLSGYFTDGGGGSTRQVIGGAEGSDGEARIFAGVVDDYGAGTLTTGQHLFWGLFNGASSQLFINGTGLGVKSIGTNGFNGISIGGYYNGIGYHVDGNIQEVIAYTSNQTSNQTAIESNINGHYSIY